MSRRTPDHQPSPEDLKGSSAQVDAPPRKRLPRVSRPVRAIGGSFAAAVIATGAVEAISSQSGGHTPEQPRVKQGKHVDKPASSEVFFDRKAGREISGELDLEHGSGTVHFGQRESELREGPRYNGPHPGPPDSLEIERPDGSKTVIPKDKIVAPHLGNDQAPDIHADPNAGGEATNPAAPEVDPDTGGTPGP